jgi:radical SAM protein with 4Fe4S-binding SPASM domain
MKSTCDKHPISHVNFEINTSRALQYSYSSIAWKQEQHKTPKAGSYRQALKVLKALFYTTNLTHITFIGDEPLAWKHLEDLILFCRLKEAIISITTQGNARTDYRSLCALGVQNFQLPLHSHVPEIHNRMVQNKNAWQNCLASMTNIQFHGKTAVAVIVITKYNWQNIDDTILFIHSLGITHIMLKRNTLGSTSLPLPADSSATPPQLNYAFLCANSMAEQLPVKITSNTHTPACILDPNDFPKITFEPAPTSFHTHTLTVDVHGNLRMCSHSPVIAGNILQDSLFLIEQSSYASQWQEIPAFCTKCDKWQQCKGGLRAVSEQIGKSLNHVDPLALQSLVYTPSRLSHTVKEASCLAS